MIRKYSLVIEGDEAGYSGYVPELSTILVTGKSIEDLTARAKELSASTGRPAHRCLPIIDDPGNRGRTAGLARSSPRWQ
jgi:hypothetical protein